MKVNDKQDLIERLQLADNIQQHRLREASWQFIAKYLVASGLALFALILTSMILRAWLGREVIDALSMSLLILCACSKMLGVSYLLIKESLKLDNGMITSVYPLRLLLQYFIDYK